MTKDQLAEVIRTAIIGTGGKADQVELVRDDNGRSILAYIYDTNEPDAECRIFNLPDEIAATIA